jgi:drug/metabolite transporter (DMT)-like permease
MKAYMPGCSVFLDPGSSAVVKWLPTPTILWEMERRECMKGTSTPGLPNESVTARIALLLLLLAFFWGGNAVAVKIALRDTRPFILAGLRFGVGALVIGLWGALNRIGLKPERSEISHLIILSLLFAAQICTFTLGVDLTLAGRASLFINTHPFFVAIIAHLFISNDKLSIKKLLGLILAFCGVFIIFRDKIGLDSSRVTGDGLVLVSGLLLGILGVYTKKLVQRINAYKLLLWQMIFALPLFFGLGLVFERSASHTPSLNLLLTILYQGIVVAGFCFVVWTLILKRYSASKASAFLFTTPLFGVGLSSLILQESVTLYLVIGAAFVAGGIYVVNKG